MEPRPKEGLIIPPHWKVPEPAFPFGTIVTKPVLVIPDANFLRRALEGYDEKSKEIEGEEGPKGFGDYLFRDNGDLICFQEIYGSGGRKNTSVVHFPGDTPRVGTFFSDDHVVVDFYDFLTNRGDWLGEAHYEWGDYAVGLTLGRRYISATDGSIESPHLTFNFDPIYEDPDESNKLKGWTISHLGELESFDTEHKGFSAEELPNEQNSYIIRRNGELAYKVRAYLNQNVATVEQQYAYEGQPGEGTIKIARVNLSGVLVADAYDISFLPTDISDPANLDTPWKSAGERLGDPMLSFRGPVKEFMNSVTW